MWAGNACAWELGLGNNWVTPNLFDLPPPTYLTLKMLLKMPRDNRYRLGRPGQMVALYKTEVKTVGGRAGRGSRLRRCPPGDLERQKCAQRVECLELRSLGVLQ